MHAPNTWWVQPSINYAHNKYYALNNQRLWYCICLLYCIAVSQVLWKRLLLKVWMASVVCMYFAKKKILSFVLVFQSLFQSCVAVQSDDGSGKYFLRAVSYGLTGQHNFPQETEIRGSLQHWSHCIICAFFPAFLNNVFRPQSHSFQSISINLEGQNFSGFEKTSFCRVKFSLIARWHTHQPVCH